MCDGDKAASSYTSTWSAFGSVPMEQLEREESRVSLDSG